MRENVEAGHPHDDAASVARPAGRGPSIVPRTSRPDNNASDAGSSERPPALDQEFLLGFFKALFDPARLRIAAALAAEPLSAAAVAAALHLSLAQVVKQLALLEAAAIVRREGGLWRLDEEGLRLRARSALPTPRSDAQGAATDERGKVLAALMRDGRLQTFPTGDARKLIVLREIAGCFAAGRVYSEREVNAVLEPIYADYATLRRALIDYHVMNRDHGVYWLGAGRADENGSADADEMTS